MTWRPSSTGTSPGSARTCPASGRPAAGSSRNRGLPRGGYRRFGKRAGPPRLSVSWPDGFGGGQSQAQPVGQEGDHTASRYRRGPQRERLVAGAGRRAPARDGAPDDPDAGAGGLPVEEPRRRSRAARAGAAASGPEHRRAAPSPRGVPSDHQRPGGHRPRDRHTQRCRGRRRPGPRVPGRRPASATPTFLGGPAFPAARQCEWQGASGHL